MEGVVYNIQRMSTKDGPGLRTTVFLKGCPLHCPWCSNPESQGFKPQLMFFASLCTACGACEKVCNTGAVVRSDNGFGVDFSACISCGDCAAVCPAKAREISGKWMTVTDVIRIVDRDSLFYSNSEGGITIGGGEPSFQTNFLLALLDASIRKGYHTCVDTCGVCPPDRFGEVIRRTELFLYDCKHMDSDEHKRLTGHGNEAILQNLSNIFLAKRDVRIRIPLIPGINDTERNIAALALFLQRHGKHEVDVLPYHTFGLSKYDALQMPRPAFATFTKEELDKALDRFAAHDLKVTIAD